MRWIFGVEALDQTRAAARALRRVTGLLLALEQEEPEVDRLTADLAAAEARLEELAPPDPAPRVGDAVDVDGRPYLDHARDVGDYNPMFPTYEIKVDGDEASGTVAFPIAYEGPPGIVHGGFVAVLFDCVIQHHNCDLGEAGKTISLNVRYRRPAPLLTELRFELRRARDDRRITTTGVLLADEEVLCEARMEAVAGDRDALPPVSPRRSAG